MYLPSPISIRFVRAERRHPMLRGGQGNGTRGSDGLGRRLMRPEPEYRPTERSQKVVRVCVPSLVRFDLLQPEVRVLHWPHGVFGAAVPAATINKEAILRPEKLRPQRDEASSPPCSRSCNAGRWGTSPLEAPLRCSSPFCRAVAMRRLVSTVEDIEVRIRSLSSCHHRAATDARC
jgi:hypothetical protein